ncbi:ABC-type antimicrobial peptide transport system,permease component [Candidatus Phaeomarinobacter ectocarpi]|uniref:ABC-type antimicrobial peptide transport system,permease component n=1 Tax=Candidatus Phaeomarinibacter ectocarpi TaxID=1458461 RepID=X5M7C8_9HYPH|nr:FtsX-like permease family protein [Candidatus Phaeomarinobacter ectocarpi]CDO59038.1 ABC-type antimicrobial peptide transport system,permease component [Candidatus Phaeomarinobacter ectocarpi]
MFHTLLHPLDKKVLRELWRVRGQALAIAAVIGAGVAVLVMMYGMLASLDATRAAYYERYRFADIWVPVKRAPENLKADIARINGVASVETRIFVDVTLDVPGMVEPATGRMISIPEAGRPAINDVVLRAGRWPEPNHPREVLADQSFMDAHGFTPGSEVAAIINGRKRTLTVVGVVLSPEFVYAIAPGELMPDAKRFGILWMNRDALAAAYDLDGAFNEALIRLLRDANRSDVIDEVDALTDRYGGGGAYDRDDQISDAFLTSEMDQLRNFGAVLPPIFLVVAAFLLNVVIGRMIETEREQIGLLKAFGYSNWAVGVHYLKFVGVLTGIGVFAGIAGGAWMGRGMAGMYTEYFKFPFLYYKADPAVFALGAGISVLAAFLGTLAAVRRAALLPPAVAMRPAPPTRYGQALIERLLPRRMTDQPTRMILRHIGRWPVRSGMTVTGIAVAIGLLIGSSFALDSMDFMIDVNFFQAERQTMTVIFEGPRHYDAVRAVDGLPGIMATEPFRMVGVRMVKGPREKRVSITGLVQEPQISRVLDADQQPVVLPESGVLLSDYLARLLGAREGDMLTVEVLEGRRPVLSLPVARVVESYIGLNAYMHLPALNAVMQEGHAVSGAYILNDSAYQDALYRELKDTPAVAGVTLQRKAVQTFRDTVDESFSTMVIFNAVFAGFIAIGVVYNAARISLAERARELASLRVLGFSRAEVAYILLGELALLTVLALLPGCLFGFGLAHLIGTLGMETELFRVPVIIAPSTYGFSILVVLAASFVSSLIVGRRVARLDLISVLKTRD